MGETYLEALIGEEEHMRKWKREEKERDQGTESEKSYLDALIGEEEQTIKWKREEKERDRGTLGETYLEALIGEEEHTRKGIEAHWVKHPTPSEATDALIGDEEQNGRQK